MFIRRFSLPVLLVVSLLTAVAFGQDKPPITGSLLNVCSGLQNPDFLQELSDGSFSRDWERRYAVLVFDVKGPVLAPKVYWKPSKIDSKTEAMMSIGKHGFTPYVYTTETVLVLVCNAKFGDGTDSTSNSITITPGDEIQPKLAAEQKKANSDTVDRLYLLPSVTDNTLTQVNLNVTVPSATQANAKDSDASGAKTDVVAWALIERHRMSHFSVGGGVVATRAKLTTYSVPSFLTAITTTTCAAKLTTVVANASGISGAPTYLNSFNPCSAAPPNPLPATATSYESNITTGTTSGSVNYVWGTNGGSWQVDALAGLTVYPWGRDTFPINTGKGFAVPYSFRNPSIHSLGIFLGSSVNNFGNFTVGPAYEFFPGIQLLAAVTMRNKTTLQSGIVACSGYGTSPSYSIAPNSTGYDVTTTFSAATTSAPANTSVTENKTSTTTTASSGCINGDKATQISGIAAPTQSNYAPAFSVGFLFNTNLMKAFSGVFK